MLASVFLLLSEQIYAQCAAPGSVTTSISTTPNTCAGNGSITATFTSLTNTTIQLLKSGSIMQSIINPSSPVTFGTLQPGNDYEVKLICSENNSVVYSSNPNITVDQNYTPISNADITISNVCTTFAQGGTFTVNSVTGGNPDYKYSAVLNSNPNYDDELSNYSDSNIINVTEFGTYQIRIKDECNNYQTFTKTISASLPAYAFYWKPKKICNSSQAEGSFWYATTGGSGSTTITNSNIISSGGVKLVIRADNASGAVLFNGTYTGTPFTYTESPSHVYYVEATNSCGLKKTYTHDLNDGDYPEFGTIDAVASSSGCGSTQFMVISANTSKSYWRYPITVTISNESGVVVHTINNVPEFSSWSTPSLPLGKYTVTYVDACRDTASQVINNPSQAGTPTLKVHDFVKYRCGGIGALTQVGTTQLIVEINGYLPDRANAVVTITAGPSNVGVNATFIDGEYWGWTNVLPGNYTISFSSCGVTRSTNITVSPCEHLLAQSLSSEAASFCTMGGTITSNKIYNGAYSHSVELLNASGTVIMGNVTGNFDNVPIGTYSTRLLVKTCNGQSYTIPGSTVTITNQLTGPTITSAVGVICEDAAGNPLATGSAYMNLNGVAPYTLQYKITGTTTWTTIDNAPASLTITGLAANTVYDLLLTDNCGGQINSNVIIKTMDNLNTSTTSQPCNNAPYALTIPYYAGASYEWTNPSGMVVSNTRVYSIANYTAAYNGTYICKITWTNCVTRYVNVTLDSNLCGTPIGSCTSESSMLNSASVAITQSGGNGQQAFVIDNDVTNANYWRSTYPYQYLTIDYGQNYTLNGLTYYPSTTGSKVLGYTIQTSTDGITFTNAATGTFPDYTASNFAEKGLPSVVRFANPVNARYIRFIVADNGKRVAEIVPLVCGLTPIDMICERVHLISSGTNATATAKKNVRNLDNNWTVTHFAGGTGNPSTSTYNYSSITNVPFYPAIVVGRAVVSPGNPNYTWATSPFGNADWISATQNGFDAVAPVLGDTTQPNTYFYKYKFNIATAAIAANLKLRLDYYLDNQIVRVYINGVDQNINTTDFLSYANGHEKSTFLKNNFQAGVNEIIIQTYSQPHYAGLLVQGIESCYCVKEPLGGTPQGYTKVGITNQTKLGNWPHTIPNGHIALESKNDGFVITRVNHVSYNPAGTDSIAQPKEGMVVYDIVDKCVKLFNGVNWTCIQRTCNDSN